MLDVFNSNAFSAVELTQAINALPAKPGRIGEMGLFVPRGIRTTAVAIEIKKGTLSLIQTAPRGTQNLINTPTKRIIRSLNVPHLPLDDSIVADDLQNVRMFGSEDQMAGVAELVNDKMQEMRNHHEITLEHLRAGALCGNILDADGTTVIYNLFTEFQVSEDSVDFELDTDTTDVRNKCITVKHYVEDALGAAPYDHIHALCDAEWFAAFIAHPEVKYAYQYYQESVMLRSDVRKGFEFAGIIFEEYRHSIGSVPYIPANTARFFPVGTPGLYATYFAPADFVEAVNTVGVPFYAKQRAAAFDKGMEIHTQSNPLPLCHRPKTLVKGLQ